MSASDYKYGYVDFNTRDVVASQSAVDEFHTLIDADDYARDAYAVLREEVDTIKMPRVGQAGSNGPEYYRWVASNGLAVWIYNDNGLSLSVEEPHITLEDVLSRWDHAIDLETTLAEWGLNPSLDLADTEDTNVRIWCAYNYYGGALRAPNDGWAFPEDTAYFHSPLIFATYADAQAWIDERESGTYYRAHGEHSRPDYTICKGPHSSVATAPDVSKAQPTELKIRGLTSS